MPIDVHAHYVPLDILEPLASRAQEFGVRVVENAPGRQCLHFEYGLQVRPFFAKLVEPVPARLASMDASGIERQVLSSWVDIFGHGLPAQKGAAWHRLLNDSLARHCAAHPGRFSWLASGALPDAAGAARELERGVRQHDAVGGVVAANVDGTNLGEFDLDEYWAAAVSLDVLVFIHPTQPNPTARTRKFSLNRIVQYTTDTTLAIGSLIFSSVLDRFPALKLILSHGGGLLPWLAGRFDCLHECTDREAEGDVARHPPSAYMPRLWYDTILYEPHALRYLAQRVGHSQLVIGTDYSFPPADRDPMGSLRAAGFDAAQIAQIADENPRRLFRL